MRDRPSGRSAEAPLRPRRAAAVGLLLACGVLAASAAHAATRELVLRFLAPAGSVQGYRVHVFDEFELVEHSFDAGDLAPDLDGTGRIVVPLEAARSFRVQMTAYNEGGESARSNAIYVPIAQAYALSLREVIPSSVTPGKHTLIVKGTGFISRPRVSWENGEGKPPRIRFVRVLDAETLEIGVKVRRKKLEKATTWDLRLRTPYGREVRLSGALRVALGSSPFVSPRSLSPLRKQAVNRRFLSESR